jgi:hypothetical protein
VLVLEITVDDVDNLAVGAVVLGSGGGGDPYIPELMAREAIRRCGPPSVVHPGALDPDGMIVPMAVIGSPTAMAEKFYRGSSVAAALQVLEALLEQRCVGLMPVQVGGASALVPIAAAAELGLPIVDADIVRRAFPRVEQTVFTLAGIPASPMVVVDAEDNTVLIRSAHNHDVERLARATATEMGMIGLTAAYPTTAKQVEEFAIQGSLTYCAEVGRRTRQLASGAPAAYAALLQQCEGKLVFTGKVDEINRRTEQGWSVGTVTLEHLDDPDRLMRIDFQSENILAIEDGKPIVTTPDLISLLDAETGHPVTTESLDYGHRLRVLALPAHARWRTPEGLALAGPYAFGYDVEYVPFSATPFSSTVHGVTA